MKADAEKNLDSIVDEVRRNLKLIGEKSSVDGTDLAKLVFTKRNKALRTRLINRLADQAEEALMKQYNDQQGLFDDKKKPAAVSSR